MSDLTQKPKALPLHLLAAVLLTLIGFGIRVHHLSGDSLWLDEQLTLQTANLAFPDILSGARDHPPLIYILTSFSIRQLGESEFSARLVSMFAGTLAIPLIILFGKVTGRANAGLWAGLFLAFSPFHLKYAQESRHYALLMLLSLATVVILYQALAKPTFWRWSAYGILTALNLYVHYGAFIVLASQIILIVIWIIWQSFRGQIRNIWYPLLAGLISILLYLPWMPYFLAGLEYNVGEGTVSDTGGLAPMSEWLREAFYKFGMYFEYWPYLLLILACTGLLLLLWQKEYLLLGLLLSGILLPFILIQIGSIARGSFVRYIIYVLPLYLFAAAIGPAAIGDRSTAQTKRRSGWSFALIAALLFIIFAWGPVRSEHEYVQDDWRGIVDYLNQHVNEDDIIIGWSRHFANGFNTAATSLPYYLDRHLEKDLPLLPANRLDRDSLRALRQNSGRIWIVLYDRAFEREQIEKLGLSAEHFQSRLYVLTDQDGRGTALERLITLYEKLIPLVDQPSPRCLLEKDLALLYAELGDFMIAEALLSAALDACPNQLSGELIKYTLEEDVLKVIFQGAVSYYSEQDRQQDAQRVAAKLYQLDPKNEIALDALTAVNLLTLYEQGAAEIDDEGSLEPVGTAEFVMPDNGDRGRVLFIHPPASVSFQIALPHEQAHFVSRVAMDPQSWDWGGDGSTFIMTIRDENGEEYELVRETIGSGPDDRRWHAIDISLGDFAGQTVVLTLESDPGPNGDFSADWSGWDSPRILVQP